MIDEKEPLKVFKLCFDVCQKTAIEIGYKNFFDYSLSEKRQLFKWSKSDERNEEIGNSPFSIMIWYLTDDNETPLVTAYINMTKEKNGTASEINFYPNVSIHMDENAKLEEYLFINKLWREMFKVKQESQNDRKRV